MAIGNINRVSRYIYGPCLLMLLSACGPEPVDVRPLSGGIEPISGMGGVFLGMSPDELRRARPKAQVVAYTGFREVIGGDTVIFGFPSWVGENDPPPTRSRLRAVVVTLASGGDSLAMATFERAMAQAQTTFGRSPVCARFPGIGETGVQAVWVLPSGSLTVTRWSPKTRAHLERGGVFRVTAAVNRTPRTGEAVACPQATELPPDLRP